MRLALALCLCASALAASAASAAGLRDENVLTPLPSGFKMGFHTAQGPMTMAEYVPAAETVDAWSRMITVQVFHGQGGRNPDAFGDSLGQRWNASCPNATATPVTSGAENGYPFAVWAYECPRNPATGRPESMWLKAVSGADSLYVVQYAGRAPVSPALIKPAMAYLHQVRVCDTRRPDRACPAGM
jgi:hypothetical protein